MGAVESAIAKHIVRARYEDLPADIVANTKERIFDTIGVMIAGSPAPGCGTVANLLTEWGGKAESTVLVTGAKLPAPNTCQIHGTWGHADDYCDNDDRIAFKGSATAVPAALAIAELVGATGKDVILAAALGLDLGCRIGLGIVSPKPIGVSRDEAVFTGAAAAVKNLRLDEDGVLNALGIAYSQLSVSGMSLESPSLTKRLIPGQLTRGGVWAAVLAARGFPTGREFLHGKSAYYCRYRGMEGNPDMLTKDLTQRWEVRHAPKPYPSCRFTHAPIDAALAIRRENKFDLADIERIVIKMSTQGMNAVGGEMDGRTLATRLVPTGVVDAQFSAAYCVAVALRKGKTIALPEFSEKALRDPATLAITAKTVNQYEPQFDKWPEFITPVSVDVYLKGGKKLSKTIEWAKGNFNNRVTPEEMKAKFMGCIENAVLPLAPKSVDQAIGMLNSLEDVKDIGALVGLLVSPKASKGKR